MLTTPLLNPCAVRQGATSCVSFESTKVHGVNNKRPLLTDFLNVQAINYFSFFESFYFEQLWLFDQSAYLIMLEITTVASYLLATHG